jgi:diacylglycerol kinase family enzyme
MTAFQSSMPFFIILNAASGRQQPHATRAIISKVMRDAGRERHLHLVENPAGLGSAALGAVSNASRVGGALATAGDDGTIDTVASAVLGSTWPLGILPQGAFNYFGRTHGIPENTMNAARMLLSATPRPMQVGLYPRLLENREGWKRQYGRSRLVALAAALASTMSLSWMALRGALGTLGDAKQVPALPLRELDVMRSSRRSRRIKVAVAGEILRLDEPLRFQVSPRPLYLLKPAGAAGGAA